MMNNTLHKISRYIEDNKLFTRSDNLLLAVSGGIDSMVLIYVLRALKYKFAVAHCNFQLRGGESDADELFVKEICQQLELDFFSKRFDVIANNGPQRASTQMIARELRYQWFDELSKNLGFMYVAIAHHANDQSETILQHLIKGSGIAGLRGMNAKHKNIVRPLLCIDRKTIEYLATKLMVTYRLDSSNADIKYERNKIRHHVIPLLENINPSLHDSIYHMSTYLKGTELIYKSYIKKRLTKLVQQEGHDRYRAASKSFANDQFGLNLLFEWISPLGFNSEQIIEIYAHLKNENTGKEYMSSSHHLMIDRKYIYVYTAANSKLTYFTIDEIPFEKEINGKRIRVELIETAPSLYDSKNQTAVIDALSIQLPIQVRNWQVGDYMYPLGMMKKKKKLSDLFINKKVAKHLKSQVLLFLSNQRIVFVEGISVDERNKVQDNTKSFLRIAIQKSEN